MTKRNIFDALGHALDIISSQQSPHSILLLSISSSLHTLHNSLYIGSLLCIIYEVTILVVRLVYPALVTLIVGCETNFFVLSRTDHLRNPTS